MGTANPARASGAGHRLGSLAVGPQADISALEIRAGDWMVRDVSARASGSTGRWSRS